MMNIQGVDYFGRRKVQKQVVGDGCVVRCR